MKILIPLFSPPAGTFGSLTRTLSFAKFLQTSDHQVMFCASGHIATTIENKGYQVLQTPAATMLGLPRFISRIMVKRLQKTQIPVREGESIGNVWFVQWISGMTKKSYLLKLVQCQLEAARTFKPDCIFTEMDFGAYLVARITGIPIITTYATIAEGGIGSFPWKRVKSAANYVLGHFQLGETTPEAFCFNKDILKIIPSIPELDGAEPTREDIRYVGNMIERIANTKSAFTPEKQKKYIFVYMGTGSVSLQRIEAILPQIFEGMPEYICIVASQSITKNKKIGNVEFKSYIQADELLPHCEWTICHGGLNTITQSIEYNVPLLIFPGPIFERRFNAQKVVEQKAGFMGELSDFNVEWFREKIRRHEEILPNIIRLSERFKSYNGSKDAFEAIEKWLN